MKTSAGAIPQLTKPKLLPAVCPIKFDIFFGPCLNACLTVLDLDYLNNHDRHNIGDHIALTLALNAYPDNADLASVMVRRYQCLVLAIDNGVLADIGELYFGDRDDLVKMHPNIMIKHRAVMAAAFADLLDGKADGFTRDCLSAAILSIPTGCPLDDCPDESDDGDGCPKPH